MRFIIMTVAAFLLFQGQAKALIEIQESDLKFTLEKINYSKSISFVP